MNRRSPARRGASRVQDAAETQFSHVFLKALEIPSIPSLVTDVQGQLEGVAATLSRDRRWDPERVWEGLEEGFRVTARRIRHTLDTAATHVSRPDGNCSACTKPNDRLRFEEQVGVLFAELTLAVEKPSLHLWRASQCAEEMALVDGHRGSYSSARSAYIRASFRRGAAGVDARMLEWLDQLAALRDGP